MSRIAAALILVITLGGCGAGAPARPADPTEPPTGLLDTYERANQVAEQLDEREAQLEEMVADMGG
ncbi:MAG TPA: hypothetical protein VJA44_06385 [Acidimicrobiia bacterium]|nr:hypothetical protein [Acidimicrobiia bacterium]